MGYRKSHIVYMKELYHVLNRGVDGRNIFLDSSDYVRFVHNLYEFNDSNPAHEFDRRSRRNTNVGHRKSHIREQLVEIHGWCLMKNHFHLLLSEIVEGGIPLFLRKLNIGYAKYFNERYQRVGTLFQGRTKKIPILTDAQFNYILHYIHLNPLDYLNGATDWRVRSKIGIKNARDARTYLETYRWSSYLDYIGKKNFPSLLTKSLFDETSNEYQDDLYEYLCNAELDFVNLRLE